MGWVTRVADQIRADFAAGAGVLPVALAGADSGILEQLADLFYDAVSSATSQRGENHETRFYLNGREFARAIYDDQKAVAREKGISMISNFA